MSRYLILGSIFVLSLFLISGCSQKNVINGPKPFIESISPSEGGIGTEITIVGSGFELKNDIAITHTQQEVERYKKGYITLIESTDSTTLKFNIPELLGACAFTLIKENEACPAIGLIFPPGEYNISVVNINGESNALKFTLLNST